MPETSNYYKMLDLNERANIQVMELSDKPLIVYEDHRYLLNIIRYARDKEIFITQRPPNLFYFDFHYDDASVHNISDETFRNIASGPLKDFWSFVEWELSPRDDDWLTAALKMNLINDVISTGVPAVEVEEFKDFTDIYGNIHKIYPMHKFWDALLNSHGWLVDNARSDTFKPIWDILGWYSEPGRGFRFKEEPLENPLILDFDLDCFTIHYGQITLGWPPVIFENLFKKYNYDIYMTPLGFLQKIIQKSEFITIAFESPFCGGLWESAKIYQNLLDHLNSS